MFFIFNAELQKVAKNCLVRFRWFSMVFVCSKGLDLFSTHNNGLAIKVLAIKAAFYRPQPIIPAKFKQNQLKMNNMTYQIPLKLTSGIFSQGNSSSSWFRQLCSLAMMSQAVEKRQEVIECPACCAVA